MRYELIVFIQLLIMRPLANMVAVAVLVVLASDAPLNEHQVRSWAVSRGIYGKRRPAKINRSKSIVAFAAEVVAAIETEAEADADVVMSPGVVERLPAGAYTSLLASHLLEKHHFLSLSVCLSVLLSCF